MEQAVLISPFGPPPTRLAREDFLIVPTAFSLALAVHFLVWPRKKVDTVSTYKVSLWHGRLRKYLKLLNVFSIVGLFCLQFPSVRTGADVKQIGLTFVYAYAMYLSIGSLCLRTDKRDLAMTQLTAILLVTLAVYFYLDVFPLVFVQGSSFPHSGSAWIAAGRLALLSLSAVFIPLTIPRAYRPLSEKDLPNPEDTCSFLSRIGFAYVDSLIFKAYRTDISIDDLPAIKHEDHSAALVVRGFPDIDPLLLGRKRYIFWSLLWVFRWEYVMMFSWIAVNIVFQYIGPWALKHLLAYMETGTVAYGVRPWVWPLLIGFGPFISASCYQEFLHINCTVEIRSLSLLTMLVFERSMIIRLRGGAKDAGASSEEPNASSSASTLYEESSQSETPRDRGEPSEVTLISGTEEAPRKNGDSDPENAHLVGKITNLLTTDLVSISNIQDLLSLPGAFISAGVSVIFLYNILGWSAFAGIAVMLACIPLPTWIAKFTIQVETTKMKKSDERVSAVVAALNVLRMIKLFAWQPLMLRKLGEKRGTEIRWMRYSRYLNAALGIVEDFVPLLTKLSTFAIFTVVMKKELTASVAFSALAVFRLLEEQFWTITSQLPSAFRAKVSFDRYNEFLNETELLSQDGLLNTENEGSREQATRSDAIIGIKNVSFSWTPFTAKRPTRRPPFVLNITNEVRFKPGCVNLILGPTASGKTSFLMALLGEMYANPHAYDSYCELPQDGGIAYASQESWVLNDTIKGNILFGQAYAEERYRQVLKQCALERDLELWEAGDLTEVGERGITLSGGQKARITLARAIYSPAQVLLLDDILAALDIHTAKWVAAQALGGSLLAGRTVLLVTHNIALTARIAQYAVLLGRHGQIAKQGLISEVLSDSFVQKEMKEEETKIKGDIIDEVKETPPLSQDPESTSGRKLIVQEEKALGRIEWSAVAMYLGAAGGILSWTAFLGCRLAAALVTVASSWFIAYWASQYESQPASEVNAWVYLGLYAAITVFSQIVEASGKLIWAWCSLRASALLHHRLLESIFGATFRWFDTVPIGRIITRCTQDIGTIDDTLSNHIEGFVFLVTAMSVSLLVAVYMTGWPVLACGVVLGGLSMWLSTVYMKAKLPIRREMMVTKSPIITQIDTVLASLQSVRAYSAQGLFRAELMKRIDANTRTGLIYYVLNRWVAFRANLLGGAFAAFVGLFLLNATRIGAGGTGFTLSMILFFSRMINIIVRVYNSIEVESNSLERLQEYLRIDQEPMPTQAGTPPAYWPASGSLRAENLSARYSDESQDVLRHLNFEIKSGERVAVVGRTGAGKSSLALALLRAIKTSGTVYFDGIATDRVNLDALRANVTMIPQQPELLQGTLRENLDPFGQHDDSVLNDALRSAGLFDLQNQNPSSDAVHQPTAQDVPVLVKPNQHLPSVNLDSIIDGGGSNLSQGQRQICALARAIVRKNKLLILDEATASVDYDTDRAIQRTLRTELGSDTSLIIIAHRLQTVMDADKIMVLGAGQLLEYDTPRNLLEHGGLFRMMVDESDDREHLLQLAGLD